MTAGTAGRSRGTAVWRAALTFGVVASAVALAGLGLRGALMAFPLVGAFFQCALATIGLWVGSRIVHQPGMVSVPRWLGGFAVLFLGPASVELLWERQFYWELPEWVLLLWMVTAIAASTVLSLRIIAGRMILLPALFLAIFSSGSYASAHFLEPNRFVLLRILFLVWLGGWWLSAAHAQALNSGRGSRTPPREN